MPQDSSDQKAPWVNCYLLPTTKNGKYPNDHLSFFSPNGTSLSPDHNYQGVAEVTKANRFSEITTKLFLKNYN